MLRDIRYALRSLSKSPGFVTVAVLALGVGLGLSTTMFAVLDAVVNPPQPYANVDRLYGLHAWAEPRATLTTQDVIQAARTRIRSFDAFLFNSDETAPLEIAGGVVDVWVQRVSPEWFGALGVSPALGRTFVPSDGDGVVILSHWLWRRFGAWKRSLGGMHLMLGDRSYTVVGVLPKAASPGSGPAAWIPLASSDEARTTGFPLVRLRRGVSLGQAAGEMQAVGRALTAQFGSHPDAYGVRMWPVRQRPEEVQSIHRAMVGAALAVLLIACVNLAHLMLARGIARRRELALRMALGAGRPAAVGVMVAEAAIIICAGIALGAVLSVWGADALESWMPAEVNWVGILQPQLSWRVFGLATLAAAGSAALFGLVPAVQVVSKVSLTEPLKDAGGTTTGRTRGRYSPLVMAEVGLALVLMMGGALMLRTVVQLRSRTFNFDTATLVSGTVMGQSRDSSGWRDPLQMLSAMLSVPGVRDAAVFVTGHAAGRAVTAELSEDSTRLLTTGGYELVSPAFLRVMGLPILKGRDFEAGDATGQGAAILSAIAAARLYPHRDAVGHMLKLGGPGSAAPWVPIVGVARTPMLNAEHEEVAEPRFWVVQPIPAGRAVSLLVRAAPHDPRVAWRVTQALQRAAPRTWVDVHPFNSVWDREIASRAFLAKVFVGMGAVGLALAALGLYAVLAYAVAERMREFAVRIALGAEQRALFRLVLRDGLVMLLAGTGVGAFLAMMAGFLLNAVLFEVYPVDAVSLGAAEAVLIGTGLTAAVAPARRAMRADPIAILRAT
jgi:predicted permease